jgi:hypothetical protein
MQPGAGDLRCCPKEHQWVNSLEDPEEAKKPQFRNLGKGKKKAKGRARPAEVRVVRRVSMTSSAGQSLITASKMMSMGLRGTLQGGYPDIF